MNEPLTLISLGALVPLILAAMAFGSANAMLRRLVADYKDLRADFAGLSNRVDRALQIQQGHARDIAHILETQSQRERELLALLRQHFGVGNQRSSGAENNGP